MKTSFTSSTVNVVPSDVHSIFSHEIVLFDQYLLCGRMPIRDSNNQIGFGGNIHQPSQLVNVTFALDQRLVFCFPSRPSATSCKISNQCPAKSLLITVLTF